MKAVGDWPSRLPDEWMPLPLKAVASYVVSNVDKVPSEDEMPVRLCNYTDVYRNDFVHADMELMRSTATPAEIEKFHLEIGDVVITKDSETWDDIAIPALVTGTADDFVCGYHLAVLRPRSGALQGRFLFRCLQSKDIRIQLELVSLGVTRFGLPKDEIGKLVLPIPPLPTQHRIADYLDSETRQLDELVAEKERMVALLEEKRAAQVSRSVTRGLNSKAPLKPSGLDWLGDIPKQWEVKRTKRVFRERDDRSETGEEEMLTVSHLTGVTKRSEKDVNMFEAESNEGYKLCSPDNLVINTLWAWMGAMGVAKDEGIVSPAYHVYELSEEILPGYVDAMVRMPAFKAEVIRFSKGVWSSRLRLYPEGLFEVWIPVPPLAEQRAIVTYLAAEKERTAELEKTLRESITLLHERRRALITAAVTGQLPTSARFLHNQPLDELL